MTRCANAVGAGMAACASSHNRLASPKFLEAHVKQHKEMKGLQTHNLRDHMSEAELIFTALAELSTRQIAESVDATGMDENEKAARTGGGIAKRARQELEAKTGSKVVSGENFLPPAQRKGIAKK